MNNKGVFKVAFMILFCVFSLGIYSQVTITNSSFNSYNVTPNTLSRVTVLNTGQVGQVYLEAQIRNSSNEALLVVKTHPFTLNTGINNLLGNALTFSNVNYSLSTQGEYLKTQNKLPSGAYTYCIRIHPVANLEEGDEYCESIDAHEDSFLYLVYPADEEEIETPQPVLMWMHSESFNLLSQGEFFKITVVELNKDQSAQAGVQTNVPFFTKNYLSKHQVPYPMDAKILEPGKRYGWQVQKISNGNIVAKTEAWEFKLAKNVNENNNVHVIIKKKLDGSVYAAQNEKIFFRFDERYVSSNLKCSVFSDAREEVKVEVKNEQNKDKDTKTIGYNSYEIDLKPYKLKKGYYTLEVLNEKNEKYLLKFYVD